MESARSCEFHNIYLDIVLDLKRDRFSVFSAIYILINFIVFCLVLAAYIVYTLMNIINMLYVVLNNS